MKATERIIFAFIALLVAGSLIAATPIKNLVFQGDADAGGYSITNLAAGTNASNAATLGYVTNSIATAGTNYAPSGGSTNIHILGAITNGPTTLTGYGITDAQPLDADLTSIAALTTAAYGRSFLTKTNSVTALSLLGIPFEELPTAWEAGGMPFWDETQFRYVPTTSFGRGFLDLADEAAARTKVGLGNVDNTPDAEKGVYYAQSAGAATTDGNGYNVLSSLFDGTGGEVYTSSYATYAYNDDNGHVLSSLFDGTGGHVALASNANLAVALQDTASAPAANAAGVAGQMIFTDTYTYRCFGNGDWRRTPVTYTGGY